MTHSIEDSEEDCDCECDHEHQIGPDEEIILFENHDHKNESCVFRCYPLECKEEDDILKVIDNATGIGEFWHIIFEITTMNCLVNVYFKKSNSKGPTKKLQEGFDLIAEELNNNLTENKISSIDQAELITKNVYESIKNIRIKSSPKAIFNKIDNEDGLTHDFESIIYTGLYYFENHGMEKFEKKKLITWECCAVTCEFYQLPSICENAGKDFEAVMDLKEPMPNNMRFNEKNQLTLQRTLQSFNPKHQTWKLVNHFILPENDQIFQIQTIDIPCTQNLFQIIEQFQSLLLDSLQGKTEQGTKPNTAIFPENTTDPIWLDSIGLFFEKGWIILYTSL